MSAELNKVGDRGPICSGSRGAYRWLTSTQQHMRHFVDLCSDVILGRYLAVTSIDSGTPWLTEGQRAAGWSVRCGLAYSQRITSIDELFFQRDGHDSPGYDEWLLFDKEPRHLGEVFEGNPFEPGNEPKPGRLMVFVNWMSFALHDPDPEMHEMFWNQLDWVQPEAYLSDGNDCLTFVCQHGELFNSVYGRLTAAVEKVE